MLDFKAKKPHILMAPMEGVVDPVLREILTDLGGIDLAATEFVRVTSELLPRPVFSRYAPELKQGGKTSAGTPVWVQLLGSDPEAVAANAERAVEMGSLGVDLNFGCPAKRVNQHSGGAALLKEPETLFRVVSAVRKAVPDHVPVSAKVRLGFDHADDAITIAQKVEQAGASWITVHARTRAEAYRPPAHWDKLAEICEAVSIPVIGNGDIWNPSDYKKCRAVSGCQSVMIGRGLIARPSLAVEISKGEACFHWAEVFPLVLKLFEGSAEWKSAHHAACRTKQWLKLLARTYTESGELFEELKREKDGKQFYLRLRRAFERFVLSDEGTRPMSERSSLRKASRYLAGGVSAG